MGHTSKRLTEYVGILELDEVEQRQAIGLGFLIGWQQPGTEDAGVRDTARLEMEPGAGITAVSGIDGAHGRILGLDPSGYFALPLLPDEWEGASASVGRGEECDLIIDHDSISRHHADLRFLDNGDLSIEDRGSTNGTTVGGEPVLTGGAARIEVGKSFRVGEVGLTYMPAQFFLDFLRGIVSQS